MLVAEWRNIMSFDLPSARLGTTDTRSKPRDNFRYRLTVVLVDSRLLVMSLCAGGQHEAQAARYICSNPACAWCILCEPV